MSRVSKKVQCSAIIEDATKRIGDRIVPMLLSGELVIDDEYVSTQIRVIQSMMKAVEGED